MAAVSLKRLRPELDASVYKLYDLLEWEVSFSEADLHMSRLNDPNCPSYPQLHYHNAYDANHQGKLFRADAHFKHDDEEVVVPVFAAKESKNGPWRWLLRFRPCRTGFWRVSMFVLHWVPEPSAAVNGDDMREIEYGSRKVRFHQYVCREDRVAYFEVRDEAPYLEGPVEMPRANAGENPNYFYRRDADGKRKPWFVLGFARAWVTKDDEWDCYFDRRTGLYEPMAKAGCNTLYHWFSTEETSLVHQAVDEFWFDVNDREMKGRWTNADGAQLPVGDRRAYMRYDQGHAARTDDTFDAACLRPPASHNGSGQPRVIQHFVAPMPHALFQEDVHPWGECGWSRSREGIGDRNKNVPCKTNGFRLIDANQFAGAQPPSSTAKPLELVQFFAMTPRLGKEWQSMLWKHYANYWRYVIGRWSAHPALGAWVLLDELEGVGRSCEWWWEFGSLTFPWHDNLVRLLRGKLEPWGTIDGEKLPYTCDFMRHPLTTSTTHYKGSHPDLYRSAMSPSEKRAWERFTQTGDSDAALQLLTLGELERRADWSYGQDKACAIDFASHHAYEGVPYWGHWSGAQYVSNNEHPLGRMRKYGLSLPNEDGAHVLAANRWLWDSLCVRLDCWSRVNEKRMRLVTEFGCIERDDPEMDWDVYGKKMPGMMHFASWASLMQGHAGAPFKWNDGGEHGEMHWRDNSEVWKKERYPIDNYGEITRIRDFAGTIDIGGLLLQADGLEIDRWTGQTWVPDRDFRVWGRRDAGAKTLIAWTYDRTFATHGRDPNRWLAAKLGRPGQEYSCVWFNTWNREQIPGPKVQVDKTGMLRVRMPKLEGTNDDTVQGIAGNDIAVRIVLVDK